MNAAKFVLRLESGEWRWCFTVQRLRLPQSRENLAGNFNTFYYSKLCNAETSITVWSTLIGRGMSRLGSHWSRLLLAPAILCHKEPARRIQSPLLGALERKIPLPLGWYFACSSLVLYGIWDGWLPSTERIY